MSAGRVLSPSEPLPVLGHVGVAVGKMMLVWGGYTTQGIMHNDIFFQMEPYVDPGQVWIFDPEYKQWNVVTTSGDIPLGTSGAGAVVMDTTLYVFGGFCRIGNTSDLYRLDLKTMVWDFLEIKQTEQPSPRDKFMCWSYEEKFYVFGGFGMGLAGYLNDNGTFHFDEDDGGNLAIRGWNNQLCVYDCATERWTNPKCSGCVPSARAAGAAARICHNVYLFGGRHGPHRLHDLHVLDLRTLHWTKLLPNGVEPCGRSWHTFTPISDTHILLHGGYTQDCRALDDLWLLDVTSLVWTPVDRGRLVCRLWHSACLTEQQDLVIFGGCSNDINQQHAECLNAVNVLKISPHSLLRLCLDASHQHRHLLDSTDIANLPRVLHQRLQKRLPPASTPTDDNTMAQGESTGHDSSDPEQARTCALS